MAEKPNILIAVPAYRDNVRAECTSSLMHTAKHLTARGIDFQTLTGDFGDIEDARNFMASFFLTKTANTHVLMADDDLKFAPTAVIKMVEKRQPFVGCAVPLRAKVNPPRFNVAGLGDNGTAERVGAALILVAREVFEKLMQTVSVRTKHQFLQMGYQGPLYGFFDRIKTEDGRVSEDYAFCDRWRASGGEIHVITDEQIGHVDRTIISGRLSDQLAQATPQTQRA